MFTVISWVDSFTPSLAVTVSLYIALVSKSGRSIKLNNPSGEIDISSPEILYVTSSPSASSADTFPISNWFSFTLKIACEIKTGTL